MVKGSTAPEPISVPKNSINAGKVLDLRREEEPAVVSRSSSAAGAGAGRRRVSPLDMSNGRVTQARQFVYCPYGSVDLPLITVPRTASLLAAQKRRHLSRVWDDTGSPQGSTLSTPTYVLPPQTSGELNKIGDMVYEARRDRVTDRLAMYSKGLESKRHQQGTSAFHGGSANGESKTTSSPRVSRRVSISRSLCSFPLRLELSCLKLKRKRGQQRPRHEPGNSK